MEKYIFKAEGRDVHFFVQNNKKKYTLFLIHGFNSSHIFASNLFNNSEQLNFNLIAYDLPSENITFENYVSLIDEITQKVLRGKAFYYLGHSLGGAVNLFLKNESKIKHRILMAPMNPSITQTASFSALEKVIKPKSTKHKIQGTIISAVGKTIAKANNNKLMSEFLNRNSNYRDIIEKQIANREFLEGELDQKYREKKVHLYFIGDDDKVVPTNLFVDYVNNSLGHEVEIIAGAKHNPIKNQPETVIELLNNKIAKRKRWFRKFYSLKYLEPTNLEFNSEDHVEETFVDESEVIENSTT